MALDSPDEDIRENSGQIYLQRDHADTTSRDILLKLFQNAHFWELHNIRGPLSVGCSDSDLSPIDSCASVICTEPDCATLFLLFSRHWSRVTFGRSSSN